MSNNELEALVNEWFQAFFGEDHIVYTMQAMMRNLHCVGHNYNKSSNDLCTLCITMANSKIVPALTDNGLTPFLNNYGYIILFKDMSNSQLQSLPNICLHMQKEKQNLFQPYSSNFYVIPIPCKSKTDRYSVCFVRSSRFVKRVVASNTHYG